MEGEACGSVRGGRTEQVSRGLLFGLTCSLQGEGVRAGPQGWGAGRVKRRGFRAGQSWSTLCCRCLDFLGVPRLHPALGRPGVRWSWAEKSVLTWSEGLLPAGLGGVSMSPQAGRGACRDVVTTTADLGQGAW